MFIDPFGRSITYLRISLTDRCNLRCVYCMPREGLQWQPRTDQLSAEEIVQVVATAAQGGVRRVRLTGGEPLVHPNIVEIVRRIASIPNIEEVSLTTNAMMLERLAQPLADAGLGRVNVSLDSLDADKFKRITRGGDLTRVWKGIVAAERAHLAPIKLNTVIVRGLNADELPALAQLTVENDWHIRFIEVMPIGNAQNWGEGFPAPSERYVSVQEMHADLSTFNLQSETTPIGNGPARTYRIPGALGTIGFISPLGEHFCQNCNRLRLTSDGRLRSCLVIPNEVSLREAVRNGKPLEEFFEQAIAQKPEHHDLKIAMPAGSQRGMSQIGG
ncbi:MAG: GTP 3',8-cyclase MoaA [Anaerolineaceae bacterium]|jgi:cyclic pyranopterin phosphate synthase|nr:MAG: GTP 3',8-cyclase MoaA [Anaerolineaceae bacterium]